MAIVMKSRLLTHPFWYTTAEICYCGHSPSCSSHVLSLVTYFSSFTIFMLMIILWMVSEFLFSNWAKYMISVFTILAFSQCLKLLSGLVFFYQFWLEDNLKFEKLWNASFQKKYYIRMRVKIRFLKIETLVTPAFAFEFLVPGEQPKW